MMKQTDQTTDVIVIGAGAAGMMAACQAALCGARVLLLEKNEKAGKKIYITGKGRCNFTNACETEDFFENVPQNASFLYSSVYSFDPHAVIEWFEAHGVRTKIERGLRAFPQSDHASDITRCLEKEMRRLGVEIRLNTEVEKLLLSDSLNEVGGVCLKGGARLLSRCVIVAAGGLSYPSTGSTGDGYRFARETGHTVGRLSPSLVPFEVQEEDIRKLQGLSLKNVVFTVYGRKQKLFREMGEMMFTHFGVTGPLVLSASARVQDAIAASSLQAKIDLKPALPQEKLDARILREFDSNRNRSLRNALRGLYPSTLVPVIIERAGIDPEKPVHDVTAAERKALILHTKQFALTITALRGFGEAVITHGGVSVRQIDPGTMESKLVQGLFFAGEVLDVDALTGGFNLQIAWSTGHAAGAAAAERAGSCS